MSVTSCIAFIKERRSRSTAAKWTRFVAVSEMPARAADGLFTDGGSLLLYSLAGEYTLADRFFHAAFGGGFLNHFWLICACTPRYDNAPARLVAQLDGHGRMITDGAVTPDGYAINTIQSVSALHDPRITDARQLLPLQTMPTIGRLLTDAGVSWAWYSGGFADAAAGHPDPTFIYHHQPFAYFCHDYADGTPERAEHLLDERDMMRCNQNRNSPGRNLL